MMILKKNVTILIEIKTGVILSKFGRGNSAKSPVLKRKYREVLILKTFLLLHPENEQFSLII